MSDLVETTCDDDPESCAGEPVAEPWDDPNYGGDDDGDPRVGA